MITDKDRSYYIGASDTDKVIGSWKTKSWLAWWMQKIGVNKDHFENRYMKAGNAYEHRILQALNIPGMRLDEQIINETLRLRVNYDGTTADCIYECKTFQKEKGFQPSPKHINQVRVQMFAKGVYRAKIVAYGLEPADYEDLNRPVDPRRIQLYDVSYDPVWISTVYLPKLRTLADALKRGVMPQEMP